VGLDGFIRSTEFPRAVADLLTLVLRYLHIVFAVMWIGGVAYAVFVLRTAMGRVAMPARKESMRQLVPVALHYVPMSAALTIILGALLYLVMGSFSVDVLLGSRWGGILFASLVLAVATFAFGMVVVIGAAKKVLGHLEEASCDHGEIVGRLQRTFNRGQVIVLALGLVIIALMISASRV